MENAIERNKARQEAEGLNIGVPVLNGVIRKASLRRWYWPKVDEGMSLVHIWGKNRPSGENQRYRSLGKEQVWYFMHRKNSGGLQQREVTKRREGRKVQETRAHRALLATLKTE